MRTKAGSFWTTLDLDNYNEEFLKTIILDLLEKQIKGEMKK